MSQILEKPEISKGYFEFPYRIFKFFASLGLAIFVLVTLMIVLAAGTILESLYGTDTARLVIYESPWFSLLLFVLGLNLAAAAFDRIPWKKKHVGFVVTHLGIILILTGSFVTQKLVVDGQMTIEEGQTEHRITIPEPLLYISSEKLNRDWLLPLKKKPFVWTGDKKLSTSKQNPLPFELRMTAFYPKASMQEKIEATDSGPAAIKVTLHNSFVNETAWLMENDPAREEISIGPAKLRFTDQLLKENSAVVSGNGYLEIQFEKPSENRILVPIPQSKGGVTPPLPVKIKLQDMPYRIIIQRIFKNAAVEGKELVEQPANKNEPALGPNPAVELILEGNGLQEKHTVFAKFPEFPTLHGMKPSAAGVRIFYRLPHSGSKGESHELRFVQSPEGLIYQVQSGLEIKSGKIAVGEEIPTGWMDLKFKLEEFYPHAQSNKIYSAEPNNTTSENAFSAIQISFIRHSDVPNKKQIWLGQGTSETIDFDGDRLHFLYGEKMIPAGFRIQLRDFRVENYPGTNRPASFESDVTLKDDARGIVRDATISMNKPLVHRGFRIYQSGYSLPEAPGQPEISIFSVGRDPGVPLKYGGTIVMVCGILFMFYTRRFSSNAGQLK